MARRARSRGWCSCSSPAPSSSSSWGEATPPVHRRGYLTSVLAGLEERLRGRRRSERGGSLPIRSPTRGRRAESNQPLGTGATPQLAWRGRRRCRLGPVLTLRSTESDHYRTVLAPHVEWNGLPHVEHDPGPL